MPMHVEMLHQVHRGCRHCSIESEKVYHALPPESFQSGTEAVRNEAGEEFGRNTAFVKKYNKQDGVSRPNVEENSSPEKVGHRQKIVPSTMTGVSGNSPKPLQKTQETGGKTESQMPTASPLLSQQTMRRSSRTVRKPVRFGDFVLSLRR